MASQVRFKNPNLSIPLLSQENDAPSIQDLALRVNALYTKIEKIRDRCSIFDQPYRINNHRTQAYHDAIDISQKKLNAKKNIKRYLKV